MLSRFGWLLVWALVGSSQAEPARARAETTSPAAMDIATLLAAFSRMPGLEARFTEQKQIALLARPLESSGRLYFTHPGLLLRRVEAPRASEVIITPDSLRIRDAAGEQTMDLRARPDLRPFVESLTWILAGNRAALEKVYTLDLRPIAGTSSPGAAGSGDKQAVWQLTLKPKVMPLSRLIAHIRIIGRGLVVEQIEVLEVAGDKTITRIVEANPRRVFESAERAALFGSTAARDAGAARPRP